MTLSRRMAGVLSIGLLVGVTVTGCAKRPPVAPPPPEPPAAPAAPPSPPPPPPPAAVAPPPAPLTEEQLFAQKSLEQLNAERPLGDVFFNLDESTIRDDARGTLQKNAEWLKRWGSTRITVEGHADERGTGEYNLALAERRAVAVREYLTSLGVPSNRVATVSKGKEAPFCRDSNESCWQQNRRGHFLITAK